MVKTAVKDLIRALGSDFYSWGEAHSQTPSKWKTGPAVLAGHLAFDPSGKTTAMSAKVGARDFMQWVHSAYSAEPTLLVAACRVTWQEWKQTAPAYPIVGEVLEWCLGRPYGAHSQGWSAARDAGIVATRSDARKEMRGTAGLDGWETAKVVQAVLHEAFASLLDSKLAEALLTSEAQRHEARKAALSAAAKKAAATRKARALARKAG
jgi:hypothetical protein